MVEQNAHYQRLRGAALQWLRDEDRYQWSKFNLDLNLKSLKDGLSGTIWANEFGNYPLRALAQARELPDDLQARSQSQEQHRLQALQAAGKTAAVGRGLWATLIQVQTRVSIDKASQMTLDDLAFSFPSAPSEFGYVGKPIKKSPLEQAIIKADKSLPRPVEHDSLTLSDIERARTICLAASQLFMDYLVQLCPPGEPIILPRGGVASGNIESWQPTL